MGVFRVFTALLAAAMTCGVPACTGAPDRADEAHRLQSTVEAMPGVSSVSMNYNNDYFQGTVFALRVSMDGATEQQIEAVASKINELRGNDFDEFDQTIEISVAHWTSVSPGDRIDPPQVARTAALARQLRTQVEAQAIKWHLNLESGTSSVRISDAQAPGAAVDAVLGVLGDSRADIEVSPAARTSSPHWRVSGPLTVADKQRIDRSLAALPGPASWVGVKDGWITQLTFGIPNPATGYQDVVSAIKAVDAGPSQPVSLLWSWRGNQAAYNEPRFAGSVDIGKCVDEQANPTGDLTPDASALQQRIRDEFNACA